MDHLQSNSLRCFSHGSSHQHHWARLLVIFSGLQRVDRFLDWFFWTAVLPVKLLIITSCSWPWSRSLGLQGQNLTGSQPIPQADSSFFMFMSRSSTRFYSWTNSVDLVHVSLCMKAEKKLQTKRCKYQHGVSWAPPRRPCSRFGPDTVPPRCSCLFRGQALGFPSSGGTISTGTDAQIYKDELEMNRSQAETQHANPISWPRSRASPLGISTVYRHMLRRPDGALLCCTDILRMHVCIRAVNPPAVNDRWLLDLKSTLLVFRVTWPRSGSLALRPVDDWSICSGT